MLTNFCLEEYLNIGYMEGISDVFNSIRGFNMSVQVAVQSLSQWQEKYPGKEWENQLGSFDNGALRERFFIDFPISKSNDSI